MFFGCQALLWILVLTPFALTGVLFWISPKLGIIGVVLIVVVVVAYIAFVVVISSRRRKCPSCGASALKLVNWFRANPPPNYSFHRCEECGSEFVQVGENERFEKREDSAYGGDDKDWEEVY